jgi:hypothetical protein
VWGTQLQVYLVELCTILRESDASLQITNVHQFWAARARLDDQLRRVCQRVECDVLGTSVQLMQSAHARKPVVLCVDHVRLCSCTHIENVFAQECTLLPWECLPSLAAQPMSRSNSVHEFARCLRKARAIPPSVNWRRGYYVLDPQRDFQTTQTTFRALFDT